MYYVDYVYSYLSMFRIMGYEKFSEARQHREKIRDERKGLQERVTQRAGRNTKGKCHGYFNGISKPEIRFT